jgi:Golgi phosphoprotein 3 (GPP34)
MPAAAAGAGQVSAVTASVPDGARGGLGVPGGSPLGGTGLVADDLYLVAHDDRTGKPLLAPRVAGIGLAGGLLAELLLAGSAGLGPDGAVLAGHTWPAEPLTAHLHSVIAGEARPRPARDWLLYLARTSADDVGSRLERSGFLAWSRSPWVPWRSRRVPADPDWAFAAVVRAARPQNTHSAVLASLAGACGLGFRFAESGNPLILSPEELSAMLPPPARELIPAVRSAVAGVVLAHRA